MTNSPTESLILIDLFSLIFQVFHAIPEMTSPAGIPTNAVFGITRDILMLQKEKRPTYLIVAADSPGLGRREQLYPDYKANRSPMPDDLRPQIPLAIEVLKAFGIPVLSLEGWEADDVIATIVTQARNRGTSVSIVTSDKDCRQLLGPDVRMYNIRKNSFLGVEELLADWGISPEQVTDFQGLVGDSVDNIPGVPQIGPKKATTLLQQFPNLEELYDNLPQVKGDKLRQNLEIHREQAFLSRQLAHLVRDLPLPLDWECSRTGQWNAPRLLELFQELGFRRFADEMRALVPAESLPPEKQEIDFRWTTVDTPELFDDFVAQLATQKKICLDLETTGLDAVRADIVGWALAWEPSHGYYIPVQGPPLEKKLSPSLVRERLRPILENPDLVLINQNVKYDLLVLRRAGIQPKNLGLDTMIGDYLLDAGARSHGQDELAKRYLNHEMIPIKDLIGTGKNQRGMADVEIERVAEYAAEDAVIAWRLADRIETDLKREGLWDLYWDLERPLIQILAEMEWTGIRVDVPLLQQQSRRLGERLEVLKGEIHAIAGREFNIDSPIQLREILFTELKLPVVKKTKTGASTDQEVLEQLAVIHPLPAKLIEHRQFTKLKGTYLDALPDMVNPQTGRIHTSFSQVVAATGRLSSSDPNLQNIPIRTEEGKRVRQAFIPQNKDWKLVCIDYSQIELRMLAHFCHDPALVAAFEQGVDIHTAVAAQINQVDPRDVTSEMRRVAKAVNFGVIYGQSPYGLAAALQIPQEAAAIFISDYFTRYSGVARFISEVLDKCSRQGFVQTIKGRRRAITGVRSGGDGRQQLNLPERTAVNTVIQGSAADLIKLAMIRVDRKLRQTHHPARLLLQIHDELVFETPADRVADLVKLVRNEMEHALELDVPLVVDVAVGDNWLETISLEDLERSPTRQGTLFADEDNPDDTTA